MADAVSRANARFSQAETDRIRALALSVLAYDAETGLLTWKSPRVARTQPGDVAGSFNKLRGYIIVTLEGRAFNAHRLIWLMVYGRWPAADVDHINSVRSDNRLSNLREATRRENSMNMRRRKCVGLKGAYWIKARRVWHARIGRDYLGSFKTEAEAHAMYMKVAVERFGEFARAA